MIDAAVYVGGAERIGRRGAGGRGRTKVKTQFPVFVRWRPFVTTVLAATAMLAVSSVARAQAVSVLVDGEPITSLDIEHRSKFLEMSNHKAPTRQEAIDSLVNEILELREAKRYGIDPAASDVNDAFTNIATNMGVDAAKLTQMLSSGGASPDTLKQRLRAQMAWASLVRGRYKASLEIADSDVEAQLQLHKPDEKNQVGYEYTMNPVLLVVPHGSADAAFEARKRDAEALRSRFANCTDGVTFARALNDVAVRDQVSKYSADLAQQLREILDRTALGHLTPPETTAEGVQMFAICDKKETKSDTPEMREVREQMLQQKLTAQSKRYLDNLRRAAMIEYKMPEDR
jgi:peptidyl-prolyl cis-trans isomerase SurA